MSNNNNKRAIDDKTCSATTPEREEMQMLRRNAFSTSPELPILFPGSQFLLRRSREFLSGFTLSQILPTPLVAFFAAHSELIGNCLRHSARQPVTLQSPHQNRTQRKFFRSAWQQAVSQQYYALGPRPVPVTCECSRTGYLPDRDSIFRLGGSPGLARF